MAFDRKERGKGRHQNQNRQSYRKTSNKNYRKNEKPAPGPAEDVKGPVRLNKFIANSGVCSRRDADMLIQNGEITVNGTIVTQLGTKVNPGDKVKVDGRLIHAEKPVYLLINKPKGYITTMDDPENRGTVMDLVRGACRERIYPVGRLDRNTTGLLLLTNDGDLAKKLSHPSYEVRKIYEVGVDRPVSKIDVEAIRNGLELDDGFIRVDEIIVLSPDKQKIGIEIHSGRNRVVRRIFEKINYKVTKLDRAGYANLTKKDLPRGHWRFLSQKEVIYLKHLNSAGRPKKKPDTNR
jgi:23S rRNA pseudouridine2605 synthase